VMRI